MKSDFDDIIGQLNWYNLTSLINLGDIWVISEWYLGEIWAILRWYSGDIMAILGKYYGLFGECYSDILVISGQCLDNWNTTQMEP